MAASITDIIKIGTATYRFEYTGADAYYAALDGEELFSNRTETDYTHGAAIVETIGTTPTQAPAVEILDQDDYDAGTRTVSQQYPPFAFIQWRGSKQARYYLVEYYSGSTWVSYRKMGETGEGYYRVRTPKLVDGSTQQWRVTGYDEFDNAGNTSTFEWVHICVPDAPDVAITYNESTGDVEVDTP